MFGVSEEPTGRGKLERRKKFKPSLSVKTDARWTFNTIRGAEEGVSLKRDTENVKMKD